MRSYITLHKEGESYSFVVPFPPALPAVIQVTDTLRQTPFVGVRYDSSHCLDYKKGVFELAYFEIHPMIYL